MTAETALKLILRLIGTFSLFAIPFIFVPYATMNEMHGQLGLGELPADPIVGYLARSTSALYALVGGLFWTISLDLRRYRRLLGYLGPAVVAFGAALIFIDWSEGLPAAWKLWEGPFTIALGATILVLGRRLPTPSDARTD